MVISCGCAEVDETPLEDIDQDAAAVEDPVGAMQQHLQQQFVDQQGQQEQPQLLGQGQQQQQQQQQRQEQQQEAFDAVRWQPLQQLQRQLQESSAAVKVNPQLLTGSNSSSTQVNGSNGSTSSSTAHRSVGVGSTYGALADGGCSVTSWDLDDSSSSSSSDLLPTQRMINLLQGTRWA
jgi:hypothetical protein